MLEWRFFGPDSAVQGWSEGLGWVLRRHDAKGTPSSSTWSGGHGGHRSAKHVSVACEHFNR
eukprot:464897-Pelagomonas_calceolata.AAC.9